MTKMRHYAVNCNDVWRLCPDDPTEGTFVRYEDYKELSDAVIALLTDIRSRYPGQDFTCPSGRRGGTSGRWLQACRVSR